MTKGPKIPHNRFWTITGRPIWSRKKSKPLSRRDKIVSVLTILLLISGITVGTWLQLRATTPKASTVIDVSLNINNNLAYAEVAAYDTSSGEKIKFDIEVKVNEKILWTREGESGITWTFPPFPINKGDKVSVFIDGVKVVSESTGGKYSLRYILRK